MIEHCRLDHVAVALRRWSDGWPRFAEQLGGRWRSGGRGPGFAPSQLAFATGMRLELLEPNDVHVNDFLQRFLDRSGPGPHHLTFKVEDIEAALAATEAAGYAVVNVDVRDPEWKEAFIHPKVAPGVLVQLAEASGPGWVTDPPEGYPAASPWPPASLERVGHVVASLDDGRRLFAGLLGGAIEDEGGSAAGRWLEVSWPAPKSSPADAVGRVRLLEPAADSPLSGWLEGRAGRVHHLAFAIDRPEDVPGARPVADDETATDATGAMWEVPPDEATGTRLVLLAR